jgi:hypothetical protein
MDVYKGLNFMQCYEDVLGTDMNRVCFSYDSDVCVNSDFLYACKNVMDSLGCINLRNKSNCIFNQQYTKEEYAKERAKYDLGSYKQLTEFKEKFAEFIKHQPRRYGFIQKAVNSVGDNLLNCKNVYMGFDVYTDVEDSKYLIHCWDRVRDIYDGYGAGGNITNSCEVVDTGIESTNNFFTVFTHSCRNVNYTYACHNSTDLFGCVGLRSQRYCILNKQHTKEEYEALVPKIIQHMNEMPYKDKKGRVYRYGEFFPSELSPFAYNETVAQEYYTKTKEQILEEGHRWKEPETKNYTITLSSKDLPDNIKDVKEDILNQIIACEHEGKCNEQCMGAFKITPFELRFYRAMNLALPRLCSNCRHYQRLSQRLPFKLWDRTCNKCQKSIKSPYSPDREEIIYCEQCYNAEVN